jgi:hypothetical protein
MIKDVYLFTDGSLNVFDEAGQQLPEFSIGRLDADKKRKIKDGFYEGTRITLARWKKGFFELTREEFMRALIVQDVTDPFDGRCLELEFKIEDGKPNEANRTS